ncbi:MAG: hypothetical protein H0W23_07305 [Chloroflexia bacterium]|nr:hypothetical protein [Chloroflexia bacterium]
MATLARRSNVLTLRQALLADSIVSGIVGGLSLVGAGWLASVLDLSTALLAGSGTIAIAYAAVLAMLTRRMPVPSTAGSAVVGGNVAWAATGVLLLMSGWVDPNGLGTGFILVHIVGARIFAELQAMALRASR